MTFRSGNRNLYGLFVRSVQSRLRPSDRPSLQIEPLEARQLLAADIVPHVFGARDLSSSVEAAFARVSDLDQYSIEELTNTTSWSAHLAPGHSVQDVAQLLQIDRAGLEVPEYVSNTVIFDQAGQPGAGPIATSVNIASVLGASDIVDYFYPLVPKEISTRAAPNDPLFPEQWHLFNTGQSGGTQGVDGNVLSVWEEYTGNGIVIGIVDDGVQGSHPDLAGNYRSDLSFDYIDNDADASPGFSFAGHGTSVAGVAAAVTNNGVGGAGVAPDAEIAGIRLLGANQTDAQTALALNHMIQSIDISNNSWGAPDIGLLDDAGPLTLGALETGATQGRRGLGNVYVWAAGNGGFDDWSGWDLLAGSRHTIGVAGVDHRGFRPSYAEPGPNILVSAPTNTGLFGVEGITTTDLVGSGGDNSVAGDSDGDAHPDLDYTEEFGGTSSATPYVSGVVALMLEANPNLGYRDVQHILVRTSTMTDATNPNWTLNGAGRAVNYLYGFGAVNAQAAVDLARVWNNVNAEQIISSGELVDQGIAIPDFDTTGTTVTYNVPTTDGGGNDLTDFRLEHVEVTVDIAHEVAGDLQVVLTSPDGTRSILSNPNGTDIGDLTNWTFTTTRHWDEGIDGDWTVQIRDLFTRDPAEPDGSLDSLQLNFYGTQGSPTNLDTVASDDGSIAGTVYFDANSNGIQGSDEPGLAGRLVFLDANRNGRFDEGELSATTGSDGSYVFVGLEPGDYRVIDFTGISSVPPSPDAVEEVTLVASGSLFDIDFSSTISDTNTGPSGAISGSVYNDLNGNGMRDAGETGVAGMVAYVDTNNNCIIGLGEPGALTDSSGNFSIAGMEPGTYNVRLAPSPGQLQNLPCNGFQVFVGSNGAASTSPVFAVRTSDDTSGGGGSGGGPGGVSHGEVPGFLLGAAINADDGVVFLSGLHAGRTETIGITASQLSVSPGYLHAWIDFNGDGDWDDPGEQILRNERLSDGENRIQIQIPTNATAEMANARFRWSLEPNLGPFDPSLAGETEDYVVTVPSEGMTGLTANPDDLTALEDETTTFDVLANDVAGPFTDSFTLTSVSPPDQGGSATIVDGMIVYTPAPDFVGVEKFSYTVTDSLGGTSTATACVQVNNVNDAPTAGDDAFSVDLDSSSVTLPVLGNDEDIDGDSLTIADISIPSMGGTATPTAGGILYTPAVGFEGTETFTYTIDDGNGGTATATVTITVENVPSLVEFRLEVFNENGTLQDIKAGETFTLRGYVRDQRGDDALGVFSAYLDVLYDSGLVSVISPLNPGGNLIVDETTGGGPYSLARAGDVMTPGIINEIGGIAGTTIDNTSPFGPIGELVLFEVTMRADSPGKVDFLPDPADVLPLHEVSLFGESIVLSESSITFTGTTLTISNDTPTANDDMFFVDFESADNQLDVLRNDTDGQFSTALTISRIVSGPSDGTATVAADGRSIIYTPNPGFLDEDTLVYEITDALGAVDTATVTIEVNDFLVDYTMQTTDLAGNPISTIVAGQQFKLEVYVEDLREAPLGIFSAYTDIVYPSSVIDADTIMFSPNFTVLQNGDVDTPGLIDDAGATESSLMPTGGGRMLLFTVTFTATVQGAASFISNPADILPLHATSIYGIDGATDSELIRYGTASILVESSGGQNDSATVDEDTANNEIDVLANDMIIGTGPLTITAVTSPTANGGIVTIGSLSDRVFYTPLANFTGTDTFTYFTQDAVGNLSSARVTVEVTNVNDNPLAVEDLLNVLIGSTDNVLNLLSNDSSFPDPASTDNLIITDVGTTSNGGTVVIAQNGQSVIYTPLVGFSGNETFTYTISDGNGGVASALVTVSVSDTLPPAVGFSFTTTDINGNPLSSVNVGDEFLLNVFVEDVRNDPQGVFTAYLDVTWSGGDATLNGNFQYGELYPNAQTGTFDGNANVIDELGAVDGLDADAHDGMELLVVVPFTATTAGTITFLGNPAEDVLSETTVFGENFAVAPERQSFDVATLQVISSASNLRQNGLNKFDVNGDSAVSPTDAIAVINALNDPFYFVSTRNAGGTIPLMVDVNGDDSLSPIDALLVINELERQRDTTQTFSEPTVDGVGGIPDSPFGTLVVDETPSGQLDNTLIDNALAVGLPLTGGLNINNFLQTTVEDDDGEDNANAVDANFAQWYLNTNNQN